MIRDLDASKGSTKVNGQAVPEKGTVLRPGDVLAIGKTKIVVCNDRYAPAFLPIPHMLCIPQDAIGVADIPVVRAYSVDKPNKFLPEDHSAAVSPPGSFSSGMPFTASTNTGVPSGLAGQSAPALFFGGGSSGGNSGGMASVLTPPPTLSVPAGASIHHSTPAGLPHHLPPLAGYPGVADVGRTGAQSPAPTTEQWNDDDLDAVEHEQEREDEYDDGDEADAVDNEGGDDYGTWGEEHSDRRRGSSIRKEEIDSLAATLKGLGLATAGAPADVATTADATADDTDYQQVSSTSSLPASAVPS